MITYTNGSQIIFFLSHSSPPPLPTPTDRRRNPTHSATRRAKNELPWNSNAPEPPHSSFLARVCGAHRWMINYHPNPAPNLPRSVPFSSLLLGRRPPKKSFYFLLPARAACFLARGGGTDKGFLFYFSNFVGRWSGDYPQEGLAKIWLLVREES